MSKILKNNTASPVIITDVGQTVPASSSLTISPSDYDKYAQSSDTIVYIGSSTLTVNDGSVDLTIAEGTSYIQGNFPKTFGLKNTTSGFEVTVTALNAVKVDGSGATQPISASSLPLPTGASTSALQTTANTSLSSIDAGIPNSLGSALTANSMPVNIASDQTVPISAASLPLPSGASTSALQTSGNTSLSSLDSKTPALGQTNMAGSTPVVIASNQSTIPVSLASSPLPTGASTSALQSTGNTSIASIDTKTPVLGQALAAASVPVVLTSAQITTLTPLSSVSVSNFPATQPISAASLPLPAGASTSALQTTTNSSLSSIDGKLVDNFGLATGALRTAAQLGNASGSADFGAGNSSAQTIRAVIATDQSTLPISASTLPLPTGAATSTLQAAGNTSVASIDTKTPALGQALAASSVPVVLTAAQITTLTPLTSVTVTQATGTNLHTVIDSSALPTGAATSALQATANSSLSSIDAGIPAALGQTTMSASMPIVIASDQSAIPASQSGSWNIVNISGAVSLPTGASTSANQSTANTSLSSIDGKLNSLGQKTTSGSVPVTMASDQSPFSTSAAFGTGVSYSAAISAFTPAAAATDIFIIKGSATKTINITLISISGTTTAGSGFAVNMSLIKRSTANTGGTATTLSSLPHDSNNAAATAVVNYYTANPSALGTTTGTFRAIRQTIATSGTVNNFTTWEFGNRPSQAIVLRGVNEYLAINFGAITITGPLISIYVEFTES